MNRVLWCPRDIELRGRVIKRDPDEPRVFRVEFSAMRRSVKGARWSTLSPTQKIWIDGEELLEI